MFQLERQAKMLEYINDKGRVRIRDLSRLYNISTVTARADMNELAQKGLIVKTHGGVMSIKDRLSMEIPFSNKMMQNLDQKREVAKLALDLIKDGDIIILDSGSTTLELAKRIKNRSLRVITNDIKIGETLASSSGITVNMPGGSIEPGLFTLLGDETAAYFNNIRANKLFLGVDAMDLEWGISNRTMQEVAIKRAMISASMEVIAITDSSKMNHQVFAHVCDLSMIDVLIIDYLSLRNQASLEKAGIKVILPKDARSL